MIQPIPAEYNGVSREMIEQTVQKARCTTLFQSRKKLYRSPKGYPTWKYALGRIIAHGRPEVTPFMFASNDPICPTVWRTSRMALMNQAPVRCISKELCESFQRTPIPPLSQEMLSVYPSMVIMLPQGSLVSDEGENIDYLIIESNQGGDLQLTKDERSAFISMGCSIAPLCLKAVEPGIFVSASSFYTDFTWVGYLSGCDAGRSGLEAETRDVVDRIGRIAISSLLTHLYEPELISSELPKRSGGGFGVGKAEELPTTWIGKNFRCSRLGGGQRSGSDVGPSSSKRPHWRRGHWHTVACGEGRQGRRMKWYRPVFVTGSAGSVA